MTLRMLLVKIWRRESFTPEEVISLLDLSGVEISILTKALISLSGREISVNDAERIFREARDAKGDCVVTTC